MIDSAVSGKPGSKTPRSCTGIPGLDDILCGGLTRNRVYLVEGSPGAGKTTLALERGERAAFYLFDEGLGTLFARSAALGMDVLPYIDNGQLSIHHIDPAELAPGEFAHMLRDAVEHGGVTFVLIDSLNAYLQAMPGEKFLTLQMHELLSYLNQQGVTTVLVLGQHGLIGEALEGFEGVLTGLPTYRGATPMLSTQDGANAP
jgi:circadian clock protein KaiC